MIQSSGSCFWPFFGALLCMLLTAFYHITRLPVNGDPTKLSIRLQNCGQHYEADNTTTQPLSPCFGYFLTWSSDNIKLGINLTCLRLNTFQNVLGYNCQSFTS